MSLMKVMGHGQVTIPKKIRDQLDLKEGDYIEAEVDGDRVVMTPKKTVKRESLERLREVMDRVHARNPGADEDEVVELALRAIAEVRRDKHARS